MELELIRSKEARKVTLVGFFINAILSAFKLTAGIIGKSSAMIADAVHSLSDFLTDIVVILGFRFSEKPEDECHNYGHDKYETLATVMISIALAFTGYKILKSGIINVWSVIQGESLSKPGIIALVAAFASVVLKEALYRYTVAAGKKINSPSVIANAWHHRSDAFSSIGTAIGIGGAIALGKRWTILDPIASIVVSVFIFKVAVELFIPPINELLEKSVTIEEREAMGRLLDDFPGVKQYHKLRMRKVGTKTVIECHVMVDDGLNIKEAHDIVTDVELKMKELVGENSIVTIHIEPFEAEGAE